MTLIVCLRPDDMSRAAAWVDTVGGETGGDVPLTALAVRRAADAKDQVVFALPGEVAVSRIFSLPMKRQRDLRRAADLALEDQLAATIADRQMAMGGEVEGRRLVTALPSSALRQALDAGVEAGLDPDVLTMDHALLPAPEADEVVVLDLGAREAVRLSDGAFTTERELADELLEGREKRVVSLADVSISSVPNFRTGSFVKRRALPDPKPFLLAASLALAAGAIFLISSLTQGLRYASAAGAMEREAEAAFAEAFPGTPVFDLERQMRSRAAGTTGAESDFLPLTAILAEVLEGQDTTALSSLSYTPEGELTAELTFESFPDLEAVTTALSDRGVIAEEGSDARREDGAFVTRLFLRAA